MKKLLQLFICNLFSRKTFRLFRRRYVFFIVTLFFVIFIYIKLNKSVQGTYTWKNVGRKCKNTAKEDATLLYLIRESHKVMDKLKLDHFLAYGSLWGALRFQEPLPWDYDYDMGVIYDDLQKIDEKELFKEFNKHGIKIFYQHYAGNYKVEKDNMSGDIMIFRDYYNNGIMRRTGLESWIFFLHYRYYHQFPSRLVKKPLPKMMFAGIEFSVPHEGIELQKYLYPRNWWKELTPQGCHYNKTKTHHNAQIPDR